MKRLIVLVMILTLFSGVIPSKSYGEIELIDYIDVKIETNKGFNETIILNSEKGFNLYEKNYKNRPVFEILENEILLIGYVDGSMDIFDTKDNIITTMPADGSIVIGSGDGFNSIVKVDENRYRDYITFLSNGSNLLIINHINLENYLFGVLPREIPAGSHVDALRAQAVVARSFTYTSLNKHIHDGYNLCNTTHCQVYGGYEWEHPATNQAIIDTFGEFITYDGQVINTPYHSNSGGYTESSEKVWGGKLPYLLAVKDIFSANSPNSTWSIDMTPRELGDKLSANGINVGEVKDLNIVETTDSDRVKMVSIIGTTGQEEISGEKLRSIIGTSSLKSTMFTINKEGSSDSKKVYIIDGSGQGPKEVNLSGMHILDGKNKTSVNRNTSSRVRGDRTSANLEGTVNVKARTFTFEGKGYGHGVGMSQYGAIEMANSGYNYNDIIRHYYNGVEISNFGK